MATSSEPVADLAGSTEVANETLMNCIRNYKVIYDKSSKGYKLPQQKKNAWKEISTNLGISVEEAQTRYKSIRTNFSKYVKRIKCTRSGSGRSDLPELKEDYEHLRWIITHIKQRESVSNFRLQNGETVCRKGEEDVESTGPNGGATVNRSDDEEDESDWNDDCDEGNDINYGSFKEMVADVAYKPEDGETSSILEEPSRSSPVQQVFKPLW